MAIKTKQILKSDVDRDVHANNNREITGTQMNVILNDIIDSMFGLLNNVSMLGMKDHDPTFNYESTMGVFNEAAVFRSLIAQQGTFDPDTWQRITGTQVISLTDFVALRSSNSLNPNITYQIKDLYNYRIVARDNMNVQAFGFMTMHVPNDVVPLYDYGNLGLYNIDDRVRWNNVVWVLTAGPDVDEPGVDPQWEAVEYNVDEYVEVSLMASYDFDNARWRYMADSIGNVIVMTEDNSYGDSAWKYFAWGNKEVYGNVLIDTYWMMCNYRVTSVKNYAHKAYIEISGKGKVIDSVFESESVITFTIDDTIKVHLYPKVVATEALVTDYFEAIFKNDIVFYGTTIEGTGYVCDYRGGTNFSAVATATGSTLDVSLIMAKYCGIIKIVTPSAISVREFVGMENKKIRITGEDLSAGDLTIVHGVGSIINKGHTSRVLHNEADWVDYENIDGTWYEINSGIY